MPMHDKLLSAFYGRQYSRMYTEPPTLMIPVDSYGMNLSFLTWQRSFVRQTVPTSMSGRCHTCSGRTISCVWTSVLPPFRRDSAPFISPLRQGCRTVWNHDPVVFRRLDPSEQLLLLLTCRGGATIASNYNSVALIHTSRTPEQCGTPVMNRRSDVKERK